MVWSEPLAAASDATPISYVSPATGRQYVLVTLPGAGRGVADVADDVSGEGDLTQRGGKVIAYALSSAAQ